MEELNYEKDLQIDESGLDVEWLEQPSTAGKYIRNAVQSRKKERKAAERVKVVRSELVNQANEDPERTTGKSKPNAQDIEAYYRHHPEHQKAKDEWIDAAEEADFAELAQKEITYGRKSALENLVVLHGQHYFAGPKVPRDLTKEVDERRQAASRIKPQRRKKKE